MKLDDIQQLWLLIIKPRTGGAFREVAFTLVDARAKRDLYVARATVFIRGPFIYEKGKFPDAKGV